MDEERMEKYLWDLAMDLKLSRKKTEWMVTCTEQLKRSVTQLAGTIQETKEAEWWKEEAEDRGIEEAEDRADAIEIAEVQMSRLIQRTQRQLQEYLFMAHKLWQEVTTGIPEAEKVARRADRALEKAGLLVEALGRKKLAAKKEEKKARERMVEEDNRELERELAREAAEAEAELTVEPKDTKEAEKQEAERSEDEIVQDSYMNNKEQSLELTEMNCQSCYKSEGKEAESFEVVTRVKVRRKQARGRVRKRRRNENKDWEDANKVWAVSQMDMKEKQGLSSWIEVEAAKEEARSQAKGAEVVGEGPGSIAAGMDANPVESKLKAADWTSFWRKILKPGRAMVVSSWRRVEEGFTGIHRKSIEADDWRGHGRWRTAIEQVGSLQPGRHGREDWLMFRGGGALFVVGAPVSGIPSNSPTRKESDQVKPAKQATLSTRLLPACKSEFCCQFIPSFVY